MKTGLAIILILLACSVYGRAVSTQQTGRVVVDGVAARINGRVVTARDVMMYVEPVRRQLIKTYSGEDLRARLEKAFQEALTSLIERRLILDAYEAQEMKLPEWVIDQRITEIIHESFGDDRAALSRALAEDRMTFEQWRNEVRDQVVVASMRQSFVVDLVTVAPQAIRDFYDRNPDKFKAPPRVRVRLLELKNGSTPEQIAAKRRLMEGFLARAKAGEDFAALVQAHSEGSHAVDGGDMGWMDLTSLRTELAEAIGRLKIGDVGGIVSTQDGLYLLKLEGRKDEAVRDFAEVRLDIERELRNQEADRLYQSWIARLREKAFVETYDVDMQD